MIEKPKKALILGSGALRIGQAGEFDYSGSQAIKALKEEGIKTVLINPNIATIQTSKGLADKIYFLPVNEYFVEKVIAKEKPDSILLSFGGQTALNCGVALEKSGVLKKYKVKVLGTPVTTIENTEDRYLFVKELNKIEVKVPKSIAAVSKEAALDAAENIGYPVMIRAAYALGGRGSGIAKNKQDLAIMVNEAFSHSPQVLVEEWLGGWKEIEYEVVRDAYDNCITVCNMENVDPLGIHTGESIVVAPSQTLTDSEYHKLRELSIRTIRHLGIVGECNIQYALHPYSEDYRVIEVNARLSRSSALASKATGYPLAFIAAKLALGYALPELKNSITKKTTACFEPALDYLVIKIPRWDLHKFKQVSKKIGSEMKSVGEVMAIGRKFEETLQKALRMLQLSMRGLVGNNLTFPDVEDSIKNPTDQRIFAVAQAIKEGISLEKINEWSGIDKWFLYKIRNIIGMENTLLQYAKTEIPIEIMRQAKQFGFSDEQIGFITSQPEMTVRKLRKKQGIIPAVKQIDTLGAEYPAKTNYLYTTYNGTEDDVEFGTKKSVMVLGSGAYRIGSSVEFDWCCVNAVIAAKRVGYQAIMLNYNPETVSTDYDICDRLYFDEISFELVMDIYEREQTTGVIISMGGQTPNNLAMPLYKEGVTILGTSPLSIDSAEDRNKFSKLLDSLGIEQPLWKESTSFDEARKFAEKVGYPVLIRPSYVLSGAAMNVVFDNESLERYLKIASLVTPEYPVVISKFETNSKEIEIDAVANKGNVLMYAISEHVENAGVHSGDATMILPPQRLYLETIRQVKKISRQIASALKITGPFNIQFLAKDNQVKVIECNLRASRSFPFVSKVFKRNFIDLATRAMLNEKLPKLDKSSLDLDYVGVKAPQFSFSRLKGADPMPGVEMASTGEVACLGSDLYDAFLKALISTDFVLPQKGILLSIGGDKNRFKLLEDVQRLEKLGFTLFATDNTYQFYAQHGIKTTLLYKAQEEIEPNVLTYMQKKKLDLVICMPEEYFPVESGDTYIIRRYSVDYSIPLLNNIQLTKLFIEAIAAKGMDDLEIKSWEEYH
ncbi:carbamoyl-phosphate synthase (glutamine-hydrolyzing) large subunit [Candidatus Woesearchaeota archaeon]|nr:carbamoyl-phosphate synthase (glutamine-hydrolyzing) large subunit [Candidatus Woesearchaeota archaeon]